LSNEFNYSRELLAEVAPVVQAISDVILPEQMMLVGAQCRNLLHSRLVGGAPLRRTNDTDVAIAISDWHQFDQLCDRFDPEGKSGHRFRINGILTDVIPFGDVEVPQGTSSHPPGDVTMNVRGFQDAFVRADQLTVADGLSIKIPQVEGYATLKTHAWLDRSADGEYRDGPDLALAVYWLYMDTDLLYHEANIWALELHSHELRHAAAALLGSSMRQGLSADEQDALSTRIATANVDRLAHNFGVGHPGWPTTDAARRPMVVAMFDQITAG